MILRSLCCALVCISAFACEANPDARTAVLAPRGQDLELAAQHLAPVCRVLEAIDGSRRGVALDVVVSGGDVPIPVLADGQHLAAGYTCPSEAPIAQLTPEALLQCTAAHQQSALCPMTLAATFAAIAARFAAWPAAERGSVMLTYRPQPQASTTRRAAERQALVAELAAFPFREQLWVTVHEPDELAALRQELVTAGVRNVRLGLVIGDRAGMVHPGEARVGLDEALAVEADLIWVPARLYDLLSDDLSQAGLIDTGPALAIYDVDAPTDFAQLPRYEGLRFAVGAADAALANVLELPEPGPFDCAGFLVQHQLHPRFFADDAGRCAAP